MTPPARTKMNWNVESRHGSTSLNFNTTKVTKSTFLRCAHPGGVCCRQRLVGLWDSFAKKNDIRVARNTGRVCRQLYLVGARRKADTAPSENARPAAKRRKGAS